MPLSADPFPALIPTTYLQADAVHPFVLWVRWYHGGTIRRNLYNLRRRVIPFWRCIGADWCRSLMKEWLKCQTDTQKYKKVPAAEHKEYNRGSIRFYIIQAYHRNSPLKTLTHKICSAFPYDKRSLKVKLRVKFLDKRPKKCHNKLEVKGMDSPAIAWHLYWRWGLWQSAMKWSWMIYWIKFQKAFIKTEICCPQKAACSRIIMFPE